MQRVRAEHVLAAFSIGAFVVMLVTTFRARPVAMWALIAVGLFHSIMFPTIFTLGIKGLGPLTEEGSGLLIMAIAGGALVIVQGWLADTYRPADVVPADGGLRNLRPVLCAVGLEGDQRPARPARRVRARA
jgi:fucose permease